MHYLPGNITLNRNSRHLSAMTINLYLSCWGIINNNRSHGLLTIATIWHENMLGCPRILSFPGIANSFPRVKLDKNCRVCETDVLCAECRLLCLLSFKLIFRNTRNDFQLSWCIFSHVTRLDQSRDQA